MKNNFQNKTTNELNQYLSEAKAKLARLGFDLADKKLKDTSQIKKTKKEIARIMTEIRTKN
ncbi:MAG: 50S ribosomal protein L29 [Candidatus Yanofskybacteria bacterium RIFCSPHIGHO2_01_FULL_44_22]|uniref:Large ribosomal subunit protein uL29 n=1 Tax=Candidatus Yanofskybacteria bacterium RIFCSPHIGHO2_01_FULL_44_22 TaxID=1802669 RepID=A0A1F8ESY5_9BACT|nr:MAG: 50S ribosomal protein L29 [Candidatus Yanofskybacteria bacterium RIFCSPHIGHO2_01_FULL_44_22]